MTRLFFDFKEVTTHKQMCGFPYLQTPAARLAATVATAFDDDDPQGG